MTPETEIIDMSQWYCKAGFAHAEEGPCEHVVTPQGPARHTFEVPADFYSPEATARRREENKRKYAPVNRQRRLPINPMVNVGVSSVEELQMIFDEA